MYGEPTPHHQRRGPAAVLREHRVRLYSALALTCALVAQATEAGRIRGFAYWQLRG